MSSIPAFLRQARDGRETPRPAARVTEIDVWADTAPKAVQPAGDVLEDLESIDLFGNEDDGDDREPSHAPRYLVEDSSDDEDPVDDNTAELPDDTADIGEPLDELDEEEADMGVPPVYLGGARLVNWSNSARGGMTIEVALKDVGPREVNPFKGLKFGKENGQRFKTWIGPYSELIEITSLPELDSVYTGETQLMYYGDTCTKGVTVKVMLDDGPDGVNGKHPFDGMDIGNVEGMDLYVTFWAIDDDETIVPKKAAVKRTPFHQLSEVRQSNMVVKDEEFVNFLSARIDRLLGRVRPTIRVEDGPAKWAAEVIRLYLGVESRGVMNEPNLEGMEARKRWHTLISEYYQSDEFNVRRQFFRR